MKVDLEDRHEKELGNPVSGMDRVGLLPVIGKNDSDLSVIVRIDHSHSLGHPETMPERKAGPGSHQGHEFPVLYVDRQTGGKKMPPSRGKDHRTRNAGPQVKPGRAFGRIVRQGDLFASEKRVVETDLDFSSHGQGSPGWRVFITEKT
jgi:hypothetical protein